ncbi:MAG TPA: hypothetical protein PLZ29_09195, partial [Spirochaetota bacterium]|nr:hypothetical protein [Spirochaetota bacterium]
MYENIVEYSRTELKLATETAQARESASQLSRMELMQAFEKIQKLEEENKKLRAKKENAS